MPVVYENDDIYNTLTCPIHNYAYEIREGVSELILAA